MDIKKMLPFLDDESLGLYVEKIKEGKVSTEDAKYALPFFNSSHINEIYQIIIEHKIDMTIKQLLPFMDDEMIEELYRKILNNEITDIDEETILPFLGDNTIKALFKEYLNKL